MNIANFHIYLFNIILKNYLTPKWDIQIFQLYNLFWLFKKIPITC